MVIDKILFLKEKLPILSETCRWALSSGCRSWHASGCLLFSFRCAFFLLSAISLWSLSLLVSLPSLYPKRKLGTSGYPENLLVLYLNHLFRSVWILNKVEETENFLRYEYCYWYNFRQQALLIVNLSWLITCETI